MNKTKFLASTVIALASVAATSAFADSYDRDYPVSAPTHSTVTRAQVQAELAQARKDGSLAALEDDHSYPVIAVSGEAKTRADVHAELVQAVKDGGIYALHS
ncbi:DUF4148 domain-containing protein [Rhodoferax sp.]|uniref:DUF4148 domain-containing protein n=1 Tax=Rhodoferax sp. TaxID=50421 RepID=UPI00374D4C3B